MTPEECPHTDIDDGFCCLCGADRTLETIEQRIAQAEGRITQED